LVLGSVGQAWAGVTFTDDFESGASVLWGNEIGAWGASGGVYSAANWSNFPSAHSSLPFDLTDFTIDFDVSNAYDGGVWLRSSSAEGTSVGRQGVLLVLAPGGNLYWHIVPDGTSYGSSLNVTPLGSVTDLHFHVEVTGDTYEVFINGSDTAATTLTTDTFANGQAALYSNSRQSFDNIVLAVPDGDLPSVPVPGALLLAGLGAGLVRRFRPA